MGFGPRSPAGGDRAWLPRSSSSEIHAKTTKNKILEIKSKVKQIELKLERGT